MNQMKFKNQNLIRKNPKKKEEKIIKFTCINQMKFKNHTRAKSNKKN